MLLWLSFDLCHLLFFLVFLTQIFAILPFGGGPWPPGPPVDPRLPLLNIISTSSDDFQLIIANREIIDGTILITKPGLRIFSYIL